MERDLLLFVLGQIVTGAAIWGAIRSDIRGMMVRMNDIKASSDHAHKRIDDLLNSEHSHHRAGNGQ